MTYLKKNAEPKPCPFCGRKPRVTVEDVGCYPISEYQYHAFCDNEKCPGGPSGMTCDTYEGAVAAWNHLTDDLARDRKRAEIFRAAMDTVAEIMEESDSDRAERLYELLDTMKRTEVDLYAWEVYQDGYKQPGEDLDY